MKKSYPGKSLIYEKWSRQGSQQTLLFGSTFPELLILWLYWFHLETNNHETFWLGLKVWSSPKAPKYGKGDEIPDVQVTTLNRNLMPAHVAFYHLIRLHQVRWIGSAVMSLLLLLFFFCLKASKRADLKHKQEASMDAAIPVLITSGTASCNTSSSS